MYLSNTTDKGEGSRALGFESELRPPPPRTMASEKVTVVKEDGLLGKECSEAVMGRGEGDPTLDLGRPT